MDYTRRQFLRAGGLIAAGVVGGLAGGSILTGKPAVCGKQSRFKFSLAAFSYRSLIGGPSAKQTLDDFIRDCASFGLEGTELTSYYFPTEITDDYLRHLKQLSFRLGLDISGTAIRNDLCYPPGPERDKEIAWVKRWIDYAEILGAPVIRIFSGMQHDNRTVAAARKLAVAGIEECCDYAGQHGVFLALENHGGLTTDIDELLTLVNDVKSPWFGVNLDTGNYQGCTSAEEAYAYMARLAPHTLNVQVKVNIELRNKKKVPSDYMRFARIMSQSPYRGYIVLEYNENGSVREGCARQIDKLRDAFAKV